MTIADRQWSFSNPGPGTLLIWLEPWAEEFEVPVRSTVTLKPSGTSEEFKWGEVEWTSDHLVVWETAPTVEVFIDCVLQKSGSAVLPIPEGLTKGMLNIIFAGHPAARLGGVGPKAVERISWWQRLSRQFGLNWA